MPLYEYECAECGVFEQIQPINGSHTSYPCSHCGDQARRIMSNFAFELHGDGFYKNEYGNGAHHLTNPTQNRRMQKDMKDGGYVLAKPTMETRKRRLANEGR